VGDEDEMDRIKNPSIPESCDRSGDKDEHESGNNDVAGDNERNETTEEEAEPKDSWIWRSRMFVGRTVNHELIQVTVIVLILINAIMMGLGTMDWVLGNPKVDRIFTKIDRGFLVIFTLEVLMQLYHLGIALFQDGWLVFDFSVVVLSWSFESTQVVRAFRIFRAFRLITRIKPLRDLVLAIGAVLPRMYAIAMLLMIIFYVFAVLFTDLFSELALSENYFGTLDASLFTCMQMMTLDWAETCREVMEYETWAWAPFTIFIAISGFIVYNLIVAVVVEAVAITEQTVRAMDGIDSHSPAAKLDEAEERIDLLRYHLEDLMRTQSQIQSMLEVMAGEMIHLETERMQAEHREALLRNEVNRRSAYQKKMESTRQIVPLERNVAMERERRQQQKEMLRQRSEEMLNSTDATALHELKRSSRSLHGEDPASPLTRKLSRAGSAAEDRAKHTSPGRPALVGSNRSLQSKSISSKSVSSSVDESSASTRGWKRFLALQSQE
jgi:hypothetical protein